MNHRIGPIVVIGGGAGGILAAWRASSLGAEVILLERNRRPGIKVRMSGGGKCNITHAGDMEDVRKAFLPAEGRFLRPSFHRFNNEDILELLRKEGVVSVVRPDGRVFPESGRADAVVDALVRMLGKAGVETRPGTSGLSLLRNGTAAAGVVTNEGQIASSYIVVATGGVSYPKTGTTGDGIRWAADVGHTITPLRPALAPMRVRPPLPAEWRGVAIRACSLSVLAEGRTLVTWDGDVLFTHEGVSGPAALEVSRSAAIALESGAVSLVLDFFPSKDAAQLDHELVSAVHARQGRMIGSLLENSLPNRIIPYLLQTIRVDPRTRGYALTRQARQDIVRLLKSWRVGEVEAIDVTRGEVTAGGVCLREVDPQTMESRIMRGLFFCGEVLDIAGPVGGYNLQAAFSTGFVAGESAARGWLLGLSSCSGNSASRGNVIQQ